MWCYGQLFTNLMQLYLSVFVLNLSSLVQSFQLCPCLCSAMDCSMLGFPIHHQLLELTQAHVHRLGDAIQTSHPVFPFSSCLPSFLTSGFFPMSQFFPSGGQIIGASASASILPVNTQNWFFFWRGVGMDCFDLLAVQGTLKSLLQHHSSKGIYVYPLSVMSYSPCWDLTTITESKQHAKMRIKSQCPI